MHGSLVGKGLLREEEESRPTTDEKQPATIGERKKEGRVGWW